MSNYAPDVRAFHKQASINALRSAKHAQAQRQNPKNQPSYASLFDRSKLPSPPRYFESQGLTLSSGGAWRNAVCPFHADTKPSLRIRIETGAFKCMACGAHGGDVLAFHMLKYGQNFKSAAMGLGAWKGAAK